MITPGLQQPELLRYKGFLTITGRATLMHVGWHVNLPMEEGAFPVKFPYDALLDLTKNESLISPVFRVATLTGKKWNDM